MRRLRHCPKKHYTLKSVCPTCGGATLSAHPSPYSPHDKYAAYRRKEKYNF